MIEPFYIGKVSQRKKQLTEKLIEFIEFKLDIKHRIELNITSNKYIEFENTNCNGVTYVPHLMSIIIASRVIDEIFITTFFHEIYHYKQYIDGKEMKENGLYNVEQRMLREFREW